MDLKLVPLSQIASITTDAYDVNTDIAPRLGVFAESGFRSIHWCDHWVSARKYSDEDVARTKRLLDSYGLQCLDIHGVCAVEKGEPFSLERWVSLNVNRMDFVGALGGDTLVLHLPVPALIGNEPHLDTAERMLCALLPASHDRGVRLTVENGDADLIAALFEAHPLEELGFCFDSGHSNMAGDLDALEAFAERLLVVHLHDNDGNSDQHDLPGTGTTDWKRVMALCRRAPHLRTLNLEVGQRTDEDHLTWARRAYDSLAEINSLTWP